MGALFRPAGRVADAGRRQALGARRWRVLFDQENVTEEEASAGPPSTYVRRIGAASARWCALRCAA